jgi:hypothetical protein
MIMTQSKMFYLARDYQDRHYEEDKKIAVSNTTRDIFNGSNKIVSPYLDPIQHRRLETVYDPRFFLLFYFFDVLIDQAVYSTVSSITEPFKNLYNIPNFYGILGGASNLPPEQLLVWFQIYNSSAFCGRLGSISHLFYRLCEFHFLIHYPRLIEAAHRKSQEKNSLRFVYRNILDQIAFHMKASYDFHHRDVRAPYIPLQTVKVDSQLYREWIHVVLTYAQNTLSNI